jgi:preprotein translocase subunit SecA
MIENAQKKVEAHNFEIRKHNLQYDDVMNHQRALIYEQRRRVLMGEDLRESVLAHMRDFIEALVREWASPEVHREEWSLEGLHASLEEVFPIRTTIEEIGEIAHHDDLVRVLQDDIVASYEEREQSAGVEQMRELERLVMLRVVNARWIDHLAAMEDLEEGIGLRGYSGVDPLVIYRKESYEYWQRLLATIREDIVRFLFRVVIKPQETEEQRRSALGLGAMPRGQPIEAEDEDRMSAPPALGSPVATKAAPARQVARSRASASAPGRKVGRNDPCPCGSGRKYKKCCGKAA